MSVGVSLFGHFRKLSDFTGRESRASFWPYAALAFGIIIIAGMIVFIPIMSRALFAMQQFAAQHPEQATATRSPGHYSISIQGNHPAFLPAGPIAIFLAITVALAVILYAAAVVRRLHDRGKSGWWGLMPLPFIAYSSVQMSVMFASLSVGAQPDMRVFLSIFLSNLLYIIALVWLIVLLAGPSDADPNRYSTTV